MRRATNAQTSTRRSWTNDERCSQRGQRNRRSVCPRSRCLPSTKGSLRASGALSQSQPSDAPRRAMGRAAEQCRATKSATASQTGRVMYTEEKNALLCYLSVLGLSVLVPEQHLPQQAPHAQAIASPPSRIARDSTTRTAGGSVASTRCADMKGQMVSGSSVIREATGAGLAVRVSPWPGSSLYEQSRGSVPKGASLENTCGISRCVNLDHLRVARRASPPAAGPNSKGVHPWSRALWKECRSASGWARRLLPTPSQ
jgi:hypothetical protein